MTDPSTETTHGEIVSHVRYGYWFNHLCERYYANIDLLLNLAQLVGGSFAVLSVLQKWPLVTIATGIVLAVAAAVALLIQPAVKAERHRRAKGEYTDLEARAWKLSMDELRAQLAVVRKEAPTGINALAVPAFNSAVTAIGFPEKAVPVNTLQRLATAMA